jgi:amidase
LGPGVRERFAAAAEVSETERSTAVARRKKILARLREMIGPGDVLCLPTTPGPAPRLTAGSGEVELADRRRAMALLCIAGLGGLPQVTIPAGTVDGAPVGLSVLGPPGGDLELLRLVAATFPSVPAAGDAA